MAVENVEQDNLARLVNRNISILDPLNLPPNGGANPAGSLPIKVFVCPSTPNGSTLANYDLVMASYVLAEIAAPRQATLVRALWAATRGVLALVEPGVPDGYARLLAARDGLIAGGATILAPCPHQAVCPLAPPDWCHFSVRLPRSRDHRLAKRAEASFEDEKFAYLLAARPQVAAIAPMPRILARPRETKPGLEFKLCTVGGLEHRFVPRREKLAHAAVRRLGWGDTLAGSAGP